MWVMSLFQPIPVCVGPTPFALCPIPIIITSHSHSMYHFHHVPFPFSMSHFQSGPKVLSSHDQSEWRLGRRVCGVSHLPDPQPPEWPGKETSVHGSCKLGVLDHAKSQTATMVIDLSLFKRWCISVSACIVSQTLLVPCVSHLHLHSLRAKWNLQ